MRTRSDRPLLLDLYCGAGGAAMGYHRAGFTVLGVDNRPQPRYPFAFVQADALEYLAEYGHLYDAIHASPPCQAYTPLRHLTRKEYPDLVAATRRALEDSGWPWIMENVPGAPLHAPIVLCGTMFGLRVYRHRLFESPALRMRAPQPHHPRHMVRVMTTGQRKAHFLAGGFASVTGNIGSYAGVAMGIDWMIGAELSQAIPPAYTAWIGRQLLAIMGQQAVAS